MFRFIAVVAVGLVASTSFAATVTFSDTEFNDADWTITGSDVGAGGSSTAVQTPAGGNPGAFRAVTNVVNTADVSGPASLFDFHSKAGATHDPASAGAILSLSYSEDAILITGFGEGQATGPALRQGGQIYFRFGSFITPETAWTNKTVSGLDANSFALLGDPTSHPDFSEAGGPIEFGFYRGNTAAGAGYTIVGGIDNWEVVLTIPDGEEPPVIPLPAAAWMGLITMAGAALAKHRFGRTH